LGYKLILKNGCFLMQKNHQQGWNNTSLTA
jgi:hypothetical protein